MLFNMIVVVTSAVTALDVIFLMCEDQTYE